MLYLFKILLVLISIDQNTVLNWFGIKNPNGSPAFDNIYSEFSNSNISTSDNLSLNTLKLIFEGLRERINGGLGLNDIEGTLFFILFIRFVILAIRYNLKTSFYITCIGLVSAYLWYRHLIDLISVYRQTLLNIPFLRTLGFDALKLREYHYQQAVNNKLLGESVHWYDVGKLIYYAFSKGITHIDPETNSTSYIDPISLIVANLDESLKVKVVPIYYKVYHQVIPRIWSGFTKFWNEFSGVAGYTLVTRIGKRYCPYLIRWHWTFLLLVCMFESIFQALVFRVEFFQECILRPQLILESTSSGGQNLYENLLLQDTILNIIMSTVVILHIALILLALFHAIWGQYFYLPLLTETVELHIGPRLKTSVYSGGNTSWQDSKEKEQNLNRFYPKIWYGWFGGGTKENNSIFSFIKYKIKKMFKKMFKNRKKK